MFSYPISYSKCKREKGKGKKKINVLQSQEIFCNSRAPAAELCSPDSHGRGGGTREEGRRGGGERREEGKKGRSPLTCSAVPRARPGMQPRYRRRGRQRAPAGARGRKRAMGAAPEPPPPAAQPGPPRPGMLGGRGGRDGAGSVHGPGLCPTGQRCLPCLSRDGSSLLRCSSFASLTKPL